MIHLTDPKRLYIYAFALYMQTNIIIEIFVFSTPKPWEKWIQFDLHIHMILKNGLQNTQGSGTAPVWMPG